MTAYTTSVDKDRLFNTVYSYTTSRYFEEDDTSLYDNMLNVAFALLEVADMRHDTYTDGIAGECAMAVDYAYNQYKKTIAMMDISAHLSIASRAATIKHTRMFHTFPSR